MANYNFQFLLVFIIFLARIQEGLLVPSPLESNSNAEDTNQVNSLITLLHTVFFLINHVCNMILI